MPPYFTIYALGAFYVADATIVSALIYSMQYWVRVTLRMLFYTFQAQRRPVIW